MSDTTKRGPDRRKGERRQGLEEIKDSLLKAPKTSSPHPVVLILRIELLRASMEIASAHHERLRVNWEGANRLLRHRDRRVNELREAMCPLTFRPGGLFNERAITTRFDAPSAKQNPDGMLRELLHQVEFYFREWLATGDG